MRFLVDHFGVQQRELGRLVPIISAYGLVMASLYVLKPARNALFLDRLGVAQLPLVLLLVALVGAVAALVFSRFSRRIRLDRLVFFTFLVLGACLLGFRLILPLGWGWTYYLFYVWVNLYGLMATSLLWLLANALFNAREGRRLFGLIGTAGIAGAIVGGVATGWIVGFTGTENLLLVCAGVVGLCLLLLYPVRVRDAAGSTSATAGEQGPLATVSGSQLLSLLAGMAALAATVAAVIDVQFNQIVDQAFADKDAKTAFFGQFFAGLSAFALVFQIFVAPRVLRSTGVTSALLFLPASMALGSLAVLFVPGLVAGMALKIGDGGFRHSIHKSATEILYLPVPTEAKKRTKVLLDTTVDNLATGFGALLVMGALSLGFGYDDLSYLSLGLVGLWLAMVARSRRAYVDTFRQALERRDIDVSEYTVDITEAGTLDSLISALGGNDSPRRLLYALDLVTNVRAQRLVEPVAALLGHASGDVRESALQVLQLQHGPMPVDRFEQMLADDVLSVRIEAMHALCIHGEGSPRDRLQTALSSESQDLRSAALGCIATYGTEEEQSLFDEETVRRLLRESEGSEQQLIQVARLLARIYDPSRPWVAELVQQLADSPHAGVVRQLIESLGELADVSHLPWLADRLEDRRTRRAAAVAMARLGDAAVDVLVQRMQSPALGPRSRNRAARALAGIATPHCVLSAFNCMDGSGPVLEYQLLKTLSKLRNRDASLDFPPDRVRTVLHRAARSYWRLLQFQALLAGRQGSGTALLCRAVDEKIVVRLKQLFRLLALIHPPQDLYNAYLGYVRGDRLDRASAVEFLENVLGREDRDLLLGMLDAATPAAAIEAGATVFGAPFADLDEALVHTLDGDDPWLRACITYGLAETGSATVRQRLPALCRDPDPVVREAAQAVTRVG